MLEVTAVTVTRSSFRPCPRRSSGRPPAPYVRQSCARDGELTHSEHTDTRRVALLRFLHLLRRPQGYARRPSRTHAVLTVPNRAPDLIQDLYIKELKGYKPAPAVRHPPSAQSAC